MERLKETLRRGRVQSVVIHALERGGRKSNSIAKIISSDIQGIELARGTVLPQAMEGLDQARD